VTTTSDSERSQAAPARPGPSRPGRPRRPPVDSHRWFHLVVLLVFLASSLAAVYTVMHNYHYPSPIDEVVHFDYIRDVPHVPVNGERISQEALHLWACRTSGPEYVLPLPPCQKGDYNPDAFPGQAFSTAGSTPPFYYAVTAVIARPVAAITGRPLFDVARGVGAFWLTGFMVVAYLIGLRLRVRPLIAAAAALFTGLAPNIISSAATLGPDTATALTSGLVLLAALAYDGSRRLALLFVAAVALAALTKFTAFTAVGAAIVYLILRPLLDRSKRGPTLRAGLLTAAAGLATFGLISLAWGVHFQSSSKIDPDLIPINVMLHSETVPWGNIYEFLTYLFFSPATGNWEPAFLNDGTNAFLITAMAGVFIVSSLTAAFTLRNRPRVSAFGIGLVVMAVVSPFLLVALNFYANHLYFQLAPRYGYALLPGLAAVMAWTFRSTAGGRVLVLLAALSVLNVLT
jgi:hypothetical protein